MPHEADGQLDERPRKRDPDAFGLKFRRDQRTYTAGSVGLLLSQLDHCVQGGTLSTQRPRCIVYARDAALPDRIGAQMCRRVNAWAVALVNWCQYSHSTLVGINHNATLQHLLYRDAAADAERFFNLGNGCRMLSHARGERPIPIHQATARMPHQLRYAHGLWLLALRERIGNVPTPHYSRAEDKAIVLAVHVRRGDLIANHFSTAGRFVPGSFYERALPMLVHAISNLTSKAPLHMHIYSDELMALSKPLVFWWPAVKQERWTKVLRRAGASSVSFHLDGDALATLGHLLEADVVLGRYVHLSRVRSPPHNPARRHDVSPIRFRDTLPRYASAIRLRDTLPRYASAIRLCLPHLTSALLRPPLLASALRRCRGQLL